MTRYAVLALLVVVATACTSGSPQSAPSFPNNPGHAVLLRNAALDPCPPSSATAGSGGLPDVTLACLGAGPAVHLSGVRGKPMLVNIWGSWCGPCQRETPILARAYDRLKGRMWFLGVDDEDSSDSALDFAAHVRPAMHYPSVVDENKKVLVGLHGPTAVPMTLFVRADGTVAHLHPGEYDSLGLLLGDIARYLGVHA